MIASSALERARSIPIEDEVSRRGVKLRGTVERAGPCPRCGGRDRFGVNVRKQVFNCRQCGAKGNVISLVKWLDDCTFAEAIETLAGESTERPQTNFRNSKAVAFIINTVRAVEKKAEQKVVLVIIDTVSRALFGGDENSSKDMGELITAIGTIQHAVSTTILLLHHVPHESDRMRGHGNLLGAVDTTIRVEKGIVHRTATVIKANDAHEGEQVGFSLESVELPSGSQAPVVVPIGLVSVPRAGIGAGKKLNPNQRRFVDILRTAILELPTDLTSTTAVPKGVQAVTRDNLKKYCVTKGWMEEA